MVATFRNISFRCHLLRLNEALAERQIMLSSVIHSHSYLAILVILTSRTSSEPATISFPLNCRLHVDFGNARVS